jgi:hypothetical protein
MEIATFLPTAAGLGYLGYLCRCLQRAFRPMAETAGDHRPPASLVPTPTRSAPAAAGCPGVDCTGA